MESLAQTGLLALAACWISPAVMPQASRSTALRDARYQSRTFQGPVFEERLHLPSNDSDLAAVVEWTVYASPVARSSARLPFTRVGGLVALSPREFLLSGWRPDSNDGFLCRLQLGDAPSPRVVQARSYRGQDFIEVAWNPSEGRCYVLDANRKSIGWARWQPAEQLPETFLPCVDSRDLPELADPRLLRLSTDQAEPGMLVSREDGCALSSWRVHVRQDRGVWQAKPWKAELPPMPWAVVPVTDVPSRGPLAVSGSIGPFELWDLDAAVVVARGTSASFGRTLFTPAVELPLGHRLVVRGKGAPDSSVFRASVRCGAATGKAGLEAAPGILAGDRCRVGDAGFAVSSQVRFTTAPPGTVPVRRVLWIAVRGPDGTGPIVLGEGGIALLQPSVQEEGMVFVGPSGAVEAKVSLPLADDPSLEAGVLLFQFVFFHPRTGAAVVSDVFGTAILPARAGRLGPVTDGDRIRGARAAAAFLQARLPALTPAAAAATAELQRRIKAAPGDILR